MAAGSSVTGVSTISGFWVGSSVGGGVTPSSGSVAAGTSGTAVASSSDAPLFASAGASVATSTVPGSKSPLACSVPSPRGWASSALGEVSGS